jgi:hypothetical protein
LRFELPGTVVGGEQVADDRSPSQNQKEKRNAPTTMVQEFIRQRWI